MIGSEWYGWWQRTTSTTVKNNHEKTHARQLTRQRGKQRDARQILTEYFAAHGHGTNTLAEAEKQLCIWYSYRANNPYGYYGWHSCSRITMHWMAGSTSNFTKIQLPMPTTINYHPSSIKPMNAYYQALHSVIWQWSRSTHSHSPHYQPLLSIMYPLYFNQYQIVQAMINIQHPPFADVGPLKHLDSPMPPLTTQALWKTNGSIASWLFGMPVTNGWYIMCCNDTSQWLRK